MSEIAVERPHGRRRYFKEISGIIGTAGTVIGTLLALGIVHPFGGAGGTSVAQAAVNTIDKGTSRFVLTARGTLPSGGEGVLFKGTGELDYRLNRGRVTYDYSELAAGSNGQVPTTLRAILDDKLLYVQLPNAVRGKSWLRLDVAQTYRQQLGVDLAPLFAYNSSPTQALKNLEASGKVDRIGEETLLDGTATTQYRGIIDLRKVADGAPEDQRAALRRAVETLIRKGAPAQIPVDVWIADDGLVRKLDMRIDVGTEHMSMRIELYDFGIPVEATPPPADEVTSLDELSSGFGA
jgi:hypothetical protein